MKFQKGQSGNSKGRRPGTGVAKKLREQLEKDLPAIIEALVQQAKEGDTRAAKLLLDRCIPALKPVQEVAPVIKFKGSLSDQGAQIVAAMGAGKISPDETRAMLAAIADLVRIREVDDLDKRMKLLEIAHDGNG